MGAAGRGRDEYYERRLGCVGDRRQRVGGEDRQRQLLREQRVRQLAGRARFADQRPLQGVEAVRPLGERGPGDPVLVASADGVGTTRTVWPASRRRRRRLTAL
jgi:hypothetical protein